MAPHPEIDALLEHVLKSSQTILGSHFIGMYLDGSLAVGDFDKDSDVDFVVVTDEDVSEEQFRALGSMHKSITDRGSYWATQLEGSYISKRTLRCSDPPLAAHPNIERGKGERLKMVQHDDAWVIHRYLLREHGVALAGPSPGTLIDPVFPDDLRRAMLRILHGWAAGLLDAPAQISRRGYQSFAVLSICRVFYTLERGTVVSKHVAARWAKDVLDKRWLPLIERAWVGRRHPETEATLEDVNGTLGFIRYALEHSRRFDTLMNAA